MNAFGDNKLSSKIMYQKYSLKALQYRSICHQEGSYNIIKELRVLCIFGFVIVVHIDACIKNNIVVRVYILLVAEC